MLCTMRDTKKIIVRLVESIVPVGFWDFVWGKYYIWSIKRKGSEKNESGYYVKHKGRNTPNYCVFCFREGLGLFAVANQMLFYYEWAVKNHYIPLVYAEYSAKGETKNIWETCFVQPEDLKEVFDKGNVLVNGQNAGQVLRGTCKKINGDPKDAYVHAKSQNYQEYYADLKKISEKVWKFKPDVEMKIENVARHIFKPGMRVMGVILREEFGMDEAELTPEQRAVYKKHPRALSLEETYRIITEYMAQWGCTHVLISTMFEESIHYFKDRLEDKVLYIDRMRRNYDTFKKDNAKLIACLTHRDNAELRKWREEAQMTVDKEEQWNIEYATEVAIVAKCNCCMGVKCSGLIAACILNGGAFENLYVFKDENNIERY